MIRRTEYDAGGLPTSLTNGTGQTLTLTYDANAQLDTVILPDFAGSHDVVDVTVDGRGQLLEVTRQHPTDSGTTRG